MGKIFDALEKYSKERRHSGAGALRDSDYRVLMKFDEATGKIELGGSAGPGEAKSLKRLMTYRLVKSNGSLTPAGRAKFAELKSRSVKPAAVKPAAAGAVQAKNGIARETAAKRPDMLGASDWAILLKYDRQTGNLLKYDPETGRLNSDSTSLLKDPDIIQRLIDNNWILPGGWLTQQAKQECARIEEKLRQKRAQQTDAAPASAPAEPQPLPTGDRPQQTGPSAENLSAKDLEALMDFDTETLQLNIYNPLILKDPAVFKRLLENGMIEADGKLTPRALVRCRVMDRRSREAGEAGVPAKQPRPIDKKPAAAAAPSRARTAPEAPGKGKLKVIHLRKEMQQPEKEVEKPAVKEALAEPAAGAPGQRVPEPKAAPAAKAPREGVREKSVEAAAPEPAKTAAAAEPEAIPVAKAPLESVPEKSAGAAPQEPAKTAAAPAPPAAKKPEERERTTAAAPEPTTSEPVVGKRDEAAQAPAAKETVPEKRADAVPQFTMDKAPQKFDLDALDKNLVSLLAPQSFEAEQFKILRTNLLFPETGRSPRSVLVTSTLPGEGKSFVAANLAVSVARHVNWNVLLVDCDLRRPSIHRQFGYKETKGLSDYLSNGTSLEPLLLKTCVDNLTILPGGKPPDNPSELLSSDRMSALLVEVATRYNDRLIIIDSPPPRLAAESGALARLVDGIILVVKYASTSRDLVEDLIDRMGKDKVLGAIINRFDARSSLYKSKYYGK